MARGHKFSVARVRRICLDQSTNIEAARELGTTPAQLATICKREGIESPGARARRELETVKAKARRLKAEGWTVRKIARTVQVSHPTVVRWTSTPKRKPEHDQARRLRAQGLSLRQVARIIGKNSATVYNWTRSC